jgi:hypothetical protein
MGTLHFGSPELLVFQLMEFGFVGNYFINKHIMQAGIIQRRH